MGGKSSPGRGPAARGRRVPGPTAGDGGGAQPRIRVGADLPGPACPLTRRVRTGDGVDRRPAAVGRGSLTDPSARAALSVPLSPPYP